MAKERMKLKQKRIDVKNDNIEHVSFQWVKGGKVLGDVSIYSDGLIELSNIPDKDIGDGTDRDITIEYIGTGDIQVVIDNVVISPYIR